MCGRYTLTTETKDLAKRFGVEIPDSFYRTTTPRYNIAPTQSVIVVGDDGKRYMTQMRWGLIPSWAKAEPLGAARRSSESFRRAEGRAGGDLSEYKLSIAPLINARAETVAEKPAFRSALKKRRCIIPADGFYEWTTSPVKSGTGILPVRAGTGQERNGRDARSTKQPVRIVLKTRGPFGFAGLWETWTSPEGETIKSCTIITTEANELLKGVHDRMPVILPRDKENLWLNPDTELTHLLALLKPYNSADMEYYQVSRAVNSPAHDVADCIVAI